MEVCCQKLSLGVLEARRVGIGVKKFLSFLKTPCLLYTSTPYYDCKIFIGYSDKRQLGKTHFIYL